MMPRHTWASVASVLEASPDGSTYSIHKADIAVPQAAGLRPTIGMPRGQMADYLMPRTATTWLHVVELEHVYEVWLVKRRPVETKPAKRGADGAAVFGLLAGLAIGGTMGAGLVGLLLGGVAGSASRSRRRMPEATNGSKTNGSKTNKRDGESDE